MTAQLSFAFATPQGSGVPALGRVLLISNNLNRTRLAVKFGIAVVGPSSRHQFAGSLNNLGLQVDIEAGIDERMDIDLATDAALRYLMSNKVLFKDWRLSALAYNQGEKGLQKTIDQVGSKDPWILVESGMLPKETEEYLPKLMAAILIAKNAEILR